MKTRTLIIAIAILFSGIIFSLLLFCSRATLRAPIIEAETLIISKIAFDSNRDGNRELFLMNADGSNQTRLTNNNSDEFHPSLSPDGSTIAFVSNRDGNTEIYIMNLDDSTQTRLTNNFSEDWLPLWSPDGSKFLFCSNRDGNWEIYVMNSDGSNQTRYTNHPANDWLHSWSPDGSKIAFLSRRDGNDEIYIMNADGSEKTNITNYPAHDFQPFWSPDGSKISFVSERDGNREIYVMNTDGSNQTRLTNNNARDRWPRWSPDGSKIAFESVRDSNREIYVMNADGSNQTRLTNNVAEDRFPSWFGNFKVTIIHWSVELIFSENNKNMGSLQFGIHSNATNGIDASLGEVELPPKPAEGVFDVRFTGSSLGNGTKKDLRPNTSTQIEYIIYMQSASGGDITISWGSLPDGEFILQDMFGGSYGINVDMKQTNKLTISGSSINAEQIKLLIRKPQKEMIDARINFNAVMGDLQKISANAQGWYRKPASLGGGARSFTSITLEKIGVSSSNSNGSYSLSSITSTSFVTTGVGIADGDGDGTPVTILTTTYADSMRTTIISR